MANGSDDDRLSTGGAFGVWSKVAPAGADRIVGRELGDYRITGLIAEGGMGRVYRAERIDGSFERDVAIKVSLAGSMNRDLRQRFLREQQILADMNHPSVANLYDAGATEEGWPYLIMELVDGEDIVSYVAGHDLTHRQIIRLFLPMLDALAFAHARLVVHRDIKASNILVDGDGRARLLDFGIAKLLEESPGAATNARPLSLVSASPEQLLGKPITTASDIYQAGLLLHQLLTGRPALPERTLAEAVKQSMEAPPFQLAHEARAQLTPDLAAIVASCLQPDPADRYRDVNSLRKDLENYLDNRPVSVRSPSAAYRFGKLIRRNPGVSTTVTALLAVLIGGTALYTIRINEARLAAEQEAATAEEVITFLTDVFEISDPEEHRGETVTARELLDRGAADIEERFPDRPLIRARLQHVIAGVYREMGLFTAALPLAESAYALRLEYLGPDDRDTLISGNDLGIVYDRLERIDDAIATYEEVLARQRAAFGSDDVQTMKTINNIGAAFLTKGDFEAAAMYLEEALERRRRVLGNDHTETGTTLNNLPIAYANLGQLDRAEQLFVEALEYSRRVNGEDSPNTILSLTNVAAIQYNRARYDEAAGNLDEARQLALKVLGDKHQMTLVIGLNRAEALIAQAARESTGSGVEEAEQLLSEIRSTASSVLGPEHGITMEAIAQLASIRNLQGRHSEALEILNSVLDIEIPKLGEEHLDVIYARGKVAETLALLGRHEEALMAYRFIDRALDTRFGTDYPLRLEFLQEQAGVLASLGRRSEAEALFRESAEKLAEKLGQGDPKVRQAQQALRDFLRGQDDEEANRLQ